MPLTKSRNVHAGMCGCGMREREMNFVCPECNGTNTTLRDWADENSLYCSDCQGVTAKNQFAYLYTFKCPGCGTEGRGSHFTAFDPKKIEKAWQW